MRWLDKMNENIRKGIRSWLQITPSNPYSIQINEVMDFELAAIRNRIWYRGTAMSLSRCTNRIRNMLIRGSSGQAGAARGWRCARSIPACRGLWSEP